MADKRDVRSALRAYEEPSMLQSAWDEISGAFARYGRRSGAQRDASLELLNQASAPGTDPIMGAGQKLLGLAGLITHPLAFFPTREEWDQRLQAAGNDSRIGRSIGGFLSDLPSLIDPQMAAGGAVLATAPLAAKVLNKADDVASLKAWRPPEIRDVTDKWDTDVYHATGNIFDEFRPSYRGSSFFGASPNLAREGASAGAGDGTGSGTKYIVSAKVPSEEVRGLAFTPKERQWFNELPDVVAEADLNAIMASKPTVDIPDWYYLYDEVQQPDGSYVYKKNKDAWKTSYKNAVETGRDVYRSQIPHWGPQTDEGKIAQWVKDMGMSGYLTQDEAGVTVAMSDPNRIWMRSHSGKLNKADDVADAGIIAYHGSPHSFDKFDMSKIGTGEGAQAYGHGLYFAEAEDVAKTYRDTLSDVNAPTNRGAQNWVRMEGGESEALQAIDKLISDPQGKAYQDPRMIAIAERIKNGRYKSDNPGSMYQVKIDATPEEFLNWDIPLSQQPKNVQEALRGLDPSLFAVDTWASKLDGAKTKGRTVSYGPDNRTGEAAARAFEENLGGPEMAAEKLKAAGIKGVRYLDQGSRNAGGWHITPPDQTVSGKWMVKSSDYNSKGMHFDNEEEARAALNSKIAGQTYNYVVFDDKLITILKKYGIPMTAGVGGAMMVAGQDMPPELASQMGGT